MDPPIIPMDSQPANASMRASSSRELVVDRTPINIASYSGEQFNMWRFQLQSIFRSRDLLDIVDGTEELNPLATEPIR